MGSSPVTHSSGSFAAGLLFTEPPHRTFMRTTTQPGESKPPGRCPAQVSPRVPAASHLEERPAGPADLPPQVRLHRGPRQDRLRGIGSQALDRVADSLVNQEKFVKAVGATAAPPRSGPDGIRSPPPILSPTTSAKSSKPSIAAADLRTSMPQLRTRSRPVTSGSAGTARQICEGLKAQAEVVAEREPVVSPGAAPGRART